jgi:dihydroorotase (multifunctional complex type)
MDASLLMRGGLLVDGRSTRRADVRVRAGIVAEVGPDLRPEGEHVVDAAGLHVLPGIIDAHQHQWEPGHASRPDFRDDTASALAGGITTVIDQPLTRPVVLDERAFRDKVTLGERTSLLDFGLFAAASPDRLAELPALWAAGAAGFKAFTCDTGSEMKAFVELADQRLLLGRIAAMEAIVLVHAEDQAIMDANRERLEQEGRHDAVAFSAWHDTRAEAGAVRRILDLVHVTGARVYFVHVSSPEAVRSIAAVGRVSHRTYAETCPHYLFLSTEDIIRAGHRATTSPPVRDTGARDRLRHMLPHDVSVVGSDHCSVLLARKMVADGLEGQPGLPGNGYMVPLMLELVAQRVITLERLVRLVCENPALLFGLSTRKGFLRPGSDGDVTLVDLDGTTVVGAGPALGAARWSPYEGWRLRGRVIGSFLRGIPASSWGQPCMEPGSGRFVRRTGPQDLLWPL